MPDDSLVKPLQQAVRSERAKALQDRAVHIREVAPQKVQRALDLAAEKGSSVWLTVLPLREMGFNLRGSSATQSNCAMIGRLMISHPPVYAAIFSQ